jgi:hypothetical protein
MRAGSLVGCAGVLLLRPTGRYVVALAAADGSHGIPGCDGLVLDLDALWADAEALPEDELD